MIHDSLSVSYFSSPALPKADGQDLTRAVDLLHHRAGILLGEHKKDMATRTLGLRAHHAGLGSVRDYLNYLEHNPQADEWDHFVNAFTINHTAFFREQHHFQILAEFIRKRRKPINVWCCASSSGEEPYTLAMVLNECMNQLDLQPLFGVTGSDISKPAIGKARNGQFNPRKLLGMDEEMKTRYFRPAERNTVEIVDSIRDRVCFTRLNVLDLDKALMHGTNIIFCQNLLIYFRRWRRREIVRRLAERLAPGGLLVLGQGELTDWQPPGLQRVPSEHVLAWIKRQSDEE
jgi:chemotaxis protein methyltransferase CheR/type IV pilus assembly protein PilK